jgi:hypothetical protein
MAKRSTSFADLPFETLLSIFTKAIALDDPTAAPSISAAAHAALACKDLNKVWVAIRLSPQEHQLIPWLVSVGKGAAGKILVQLGVPNPHQELEAMLMLKPKHLCRLVLNMQRLHASALSDWPLQRSFQTEPYRCHEEREQ